MRSSSGGLREAPAGQGPCPAPGPSNTIYYFQYLLLLPLPTAVFFLLEIYHVHVLNNTKITSAFYFFWKVFYTWSHWLPPLQCTTPYGPPSVLGQQYENLSHVQLTSKASKCHPQLVTVNRPLLKKECIPGFHSAINVAAFQWNWNKINSVPKSISSNAFNWIHAIIHIIKKKITISCGLIFFGSQFLSTCS